MKKHTRLAWVLLSLTLLLSACNTGAIPSTSSSQSPTTTEGETSQDSPDAAMPLEISFDFSRGNEGFIADFSDLPVDYEASIYELESGISPLPEALGGADAFRLKGANRSDDLFMFIKRELDSADGIRPNQKYMVTFELEFASNASSGSMGIGGSPAESVYVKAGVSSIEPKVIEGTEGDTKMFWMNIDKGQQSQEGKDAIVIGNVAKQDGSEDESFSLVQLNSEGQSFTVTSSGDGSLWLFFGTDSGFEGTTELFYTKADIVLTPVD